MSIASSMRRRSIRLIAAVISANTATTPATHASTPAGLRPVGSAKVFSSGFNATPEGPSHHVKVACRMSANARAMVWANPSKIPEVAASTGAVTMLWIWSTTPATA